MSEISATFVGGCMDRKRQITPPSYRELRFPIKRKLDDGTVVIDADHYRLETLGFGPQSRYFWIIEGMTTEEAFFKILDAYGEATALIAKQKQEIEDLYRTLASIMHASGATITTPTNQERKST